MRTLRCLFLFSALAFVVGCSGNVKLTGTVSYSDDGAPVETGTVCFVSKSSDFMSRGNITDGTFTMSTLKADDGLPPGDYDVYFTGVEGVVREGGTNAAGESTEPQTAPTIDLKYMSPSTSGISQTVDKSTKTIEFKLDRNPNFKPQ